jgi:hypothetical protein
VSVDVDEGNNKGVCDDVLDMEKIITQRPMRLDTPFSEVDSDNDYIVYNRAVYITNTPI